MMVMTFYMITAWPIVYGDGGGGDAGDDVLYDDC